MFLQKYSHTNFTEILGKILVPSLLEKSDVFICTVQCYLHWQKGAELLLMRYSYRSPSSRQGPKCHYLPLKQKAYGISSLKEGKVMRIKTYNLVFHSLCSDLHKSCNFTCSVGNSCWANSFFHLICLLFYSCLAPQQVTYEGLELCFACQCKLTIYTTWLTWEHKICLATCTFKLWFGKH